MWAFIAEAPAVPRTAQVMAPSVAKRRVGSAKSWTQSVRLVFRRIVAGIGNLCRRKMASWRLALR